MLKGGEMIKRILKIIVVLLGISLISYLLLYLSPGDPVRAMFAVSGNIPSEEVLEQMRHELGLDRPFFVQYFDWLFSCLQLDFGTSYSTGEPVLGMLVSRLWPTISLAGLSMVFLILFAFPLGILSALNQDGIIDNIMRTITFLCISLPNFWVGMMLLHIFALQLDLLPVVSTSGGIDRLILPAISLALAMSGQFARQIRGAVLEELNQDYVAGAKARGISSNIILCRHVVPNAILPLLTMFGLSLGSLLGGTAVVEIIFSYPALGSLALNAITAMDYPVIQGFVLWVALIYMLVNMFVDASYKYLDPRVKKGGQKYAKK